MLIPQHAPLPHTRVGVRPRIYTVKYCLSSASFAFRTVFVLIRLICGETPRFKPIISAQKPKRRQNRENPHLRPRAPFGIEHISR